MSPLDLMSYKGRQEVFSGHASPTTSWKRCEANHEDDANAEGDGWNVTFLLTPPEDGLQAYFEICPSEYGNVRPLSVEASTRLLCHMLTHQLPARGLSELLGSLFEMKSYYGEAPSALTSSQEFEPISCSMLEPEAAPVFPVTEE